MVDSTASDTLTLIGTRLEQDAGILLLSSALSRQQLAAACLCAGGSSQPPRTRQLDRILEQMSRGQPFVARLAGARLEMQDGVLRVMREAGEHQRGEGLAHDLPQNETVIWDGRFEMTASTGGMTVLPLAGHVGKLPPTQQNRLKALPAAARPGLPVIRDDQGRYSCPILANRFPVSVRSLALARFRAATGQIRHEADMLTVAKHGKATDDDLC
jgi:tRNA(Ile)-lysidine synthase